MAREPTGAPTYLRPNGPVAVRALLPDDPGAALRIAQHLMQDTPRMLNHHRGLWGYAGTAADGEPLTVQATGVGGPAAAIVVTELVALGVRRLVRVGTGRALADDVAPGEIVVADPVYARDGASRALGDRGTLRPDPELLAGVEARRVAVLSTDLPRGGAGADVADLESGAVLSAAATLGVPAAVVLVVAGGDEHAGELAAGRAAASAFRL